MTTTDDDDNDDNNDDAAAAAADDDDDDDIIVTEATKEAAEKEFSAEFVGVHASAADGSGIHGADDEGAQKLHAGSQRNEDRRPKPKLFHTGMW